MDNWTEQLAGEDFAGALRLAKVHYEAETQGTRPGKQFSGLSFDM
jgi:hypothetical protein